MLHENDYKEKPETKFRLKRVIDLVNGVTEERSPEEESIKKLINFLNGFQEIVLLLQHSFVIVFHFHQIIEFIS
jgi:hypothetical protein